MQYDIESTASCEYSPWPFYRDWDHPFDDSRMVGLRLSDTCFGNRSAKVIRALNVKESLNAPVTK